MIIKNKKEKTCTLIDVAIPANRNVQKEAEKKVKIQVFMYRYTTNVEPEMYDYTNNKWSHWNSNEKLNVKFKTELWGSPLVQEKYQEKKACDKRQ